MEKITSLTYEFDQFYTLCPNTIQRFLHVQNIIALKLFVSLYFYQLLSLLKA